jgi:hypothetical protein
MRLPSDGAFAFLPVMDGAIADGLATLARVQIKFYRNGRRDDRRTGSQISIRRRRVVVSD